MQPKFGILASCIVHAAIFALAVFATRDEEVLVPRGVTLEVIQSPKLAPAGPKPRPPARTKPAPAMKVPGPTSEPAQPQAVAPAVTSESGGAAFGLPDATSEDLVSRMPELESDYRVPYPEEARKRRIQGSVIFDLLIDAEGRVRQAELVQGHGAGLNEAASQAVMKLKFKPANVNDRDVAVRIRYAYRFVLEN